MPTTSATCYGRHHAAFSIAYENDCKHFAATIQETRNKNKAQDSNTAIAFCFCRRILPILTEKSRFSSWQARSVLLSFIRPARKQVALYCSRFEIPDFEHGKPCIAGCFIEREAQCSLTLSLIGYGILTLSIHPVTEETPLMEYRLTPETVVTEPTPVFPKSHIRWMVRRDIQEVICIEQDCFDHPWQEDDFLHCLRRRNSIGMVAECDGTVAGFMIYEIPKNKIHLLNLAVRASHQRRGIGAQMIAKLAGKLATQRRTRIVLEVRERNLPAQLFFKAQGFRATSILKNYYEEMEEDAYQMQLRRIEPFETGNPVGGRFNIANR